MGETRLMCTVWRSSRKEGMYLYLPKGAPFDELDDALRRHFGTPEHAMDLLLHPGRSLARANVTDVMASLAERGFYLQMPPGDGADMFAPEPSPDA